MIIIAEIVLDRTLNSSNCTHFYISLAISEVSSMQTLLISIGTLSMGLKSKEPIRNAQHRKVPGDHVNVAP